MDKFVVAGGFFCFAADVCAISALCQPLWVVNDFSGSVHLGLVVMCQKSQGQPEVCVSPDLPNEWMAALIFIILGVMLLTTACCLLVSSLWKPHLMSPARWIAFFGMIVFCLAALTFPLGFHMPEIGGRAFKLPTGTNVGPSFFLFIICIVLTITSELFIFKVCPLLLR
ncbi:predicted protein [Nematostella vectensis]|uniref:Modulator of smoothened protein n=1 Tax=Nematostella vectensis TaxID=45351 RepID=A7SLC9_NEMVE|nr:uncharacterized protein C16orf52 homolog A [Nematostella vectensis]EDO35496.1 predicted protein [Nematostella vectensis]|eukprot:XP_001627596.1 predicted protein [Nematostella vectensis]